MTLPFKKMGSLIKYKVLLSLMLALVGCALGRRMGDIEPTAFLQQTPADLQHKIESLPFDKSWIDESIDFSTFNSIIIAPVTLDFLRKDSWVPSSSFVIKNEKDFLTEAEILAKFATEKLSQEFSVKESNRFTVAQQPGPHTLVLEVAMTEIVFGKPAASAGALIAPIPGASQVMSTVTDPSVAFEVKIKESVNGKVVATALDREFPTARIVNFNKLTATSACREVVENFSELLFQSFNKDKLAKVRRSRFSLVPW